MLKNILPIRKKLISFAVKLSTANENILKPPEIDLDYYCNPENTNEIHNNIISRKSDGDVRKVLELYARFKDAKQNSLHSNDECYLNQLQRNLIDKASLLPNRTHPNVASNSSQEANIIEVQGSKRDFKFCPKSFHDIAEGMDLIRTLHLGRLSERRSYCLKKDLAELEQALVLYTMSKLVSEGFTPMSVPDLLYPNVIEGCGMATKGIRTQVYEIHPILAENVCLSGTAEMALAGYLMGKQLKESELPQIFATVSRCYRAEISTVQEEKGIFRVHQFTKVEMFGATANETGNESELLLEKFVQIQKNIFTELGLHFKLLDMPPSDLGSPAYQKIDIEAWMPGKGIYGEISSASNCTDYQSRRLHIKYHPCDENAKLKHVHTVNGTACAVPRMLIAILENFQNEDGSITIPEVLQKYMKKQFIQKARHKEKEMNWIRLSNRFIKWWNDLSHFERFHCICVTSFLDSAAKTSQDFA